MSTAVVIIGIVAVLFVGIGMVLSQLFRMRDFLKNSPPLPPPLPESLGSGEEPEGDW